MTQQPTEPNQADTKRLEQTWQLEPKWLRSVGAVGGVVGVVGVGVVGVVGVVGAVGSDTSVHNVYVHNVTTCKPE